MKVLDEIQTLDYLLKNRVSLARYGDGELRLCLGRSAKLQRPTPFLAKKLRQILQNNDRSLMVGIPRIYAPRDFPTAQKAQFWAKYTRPPFVDLCNKDTVYGSAFITRPDSSGQIDSDYFQRVKALWRDREVLLVRGKLCGFAKDASIFETASSWRELLAPDRDAFEQYENLLISILTSTTEKTLVILSLGPTATVLASGLTGYGRQALDLGHLGMFYAKLIHK